MKKLLLSLICLLALGLPGVAAAARWSYDISNDYDSPSWLTMIKNSDQKNNIAPTSIDPADASIGTIEWIYAFTGNATTINKNGTTPKGITMGSAANPFSTVTFTTKGFANKRITKVDIVIASVSKKCCYNVSLNNGLYSNEIEKVLYQNNSGSSDTPATATFTPNCIGEELSFTITQTGTTSNTKGGFKFCSVTVEYEDNSIPPVDETKVAVPIASVNDNVLNEESIVYVNDEIVLSCTTEEASMKYTLEGEETYIEDNYTAPIKLTKEGIYTLSVTSSKEGLENNYLSLIFEVSRRQAELSFSVDNVVAYLDAADEFIVPSLYNPASLPVTFLSMEESVAKVDESTGYVTIIGEGKTTVHAIFEGNDEFKIPVEDPYYTLTVYANKPNTVVDYILVTDQSEIVAGGEYLIAAATTNKLLTTTSNDNNTNRKATVFSIVNDNHISNIPNECQIVTLSASDDIDGAFNLQCGENIYLAATGNSSATKNQNYLGTVTTPGDNTAATIQIENGIVKITYSKATGKTGKYLRYNGQGTNSLFANYVSTSMESGYENLRLFRKHEHVIPALPVIYVNDEAIEESKNAVGINVNDPSETVTIRFEHPAGHDIYVSHDIRNWGQSEAYAAEEEDTTDPNAKDGFEKYNGETINLNTASHTISFYAHDGVVESPVRTIVFSIATDVEGIASDDAKGNVKYFNLQGVEVDNPAEGIYIRVANGKAEKIIK